MSFEKGGEKKKTKAERYFESPEYKRERLKELTGIDDEYEIFKNYYELRALINGVGLDNIRYRKNTFDDRGELETELAILNLDQEQLDQLDATLSKLRIYGFPEPSDEEDKRDMFIENRRDLEVLRLLPTFKDLENAFDERERLERASAVAEELRAEMMQRAEEIRTQLVGEERRRVEEQRLRDIEATVEKKKQDVLAEWDADKAQFREKRLEEKKRMNEVIDDFLSKIQPQDIDLDFEISQLNDPFEPVTKYKGFQMQFPREDRPKKDKDPIKKEDIIALQEALDPIEVDEMVEKYTELWDSGIILEDEEVILPSSRSKVNLSMFPKRYVWKYDKKANKKICYEIDPVTRQPFREVSMEERDEAIDNLQKLRQERLGQEQVLKDILLRKKEGRIIGGEEPVLNFEELKSTELPKSKEEEALETKVLLLLNRLIAWLINDLTSQMRGNRELRNIVHNDADDLYQNAVRGLLYAVDHRNEEYETSNSLMPYIMACMEGYVRNYNMVTEGINTLTEHVRVPDKILQKRRELRKAERLLRTQYPDESDSLVMEKRLAKSLFGEDGTTDQLAKLRQKLLMNYSEVSSEVLENKSLTGPFDEFEQEEAFSKKELSELITKNLSSLSPREERVLRMRFFPQNTEDNEEVFGNAAQIDGVSLSAVAQQFGVTQERIRQIEAKALRKLMHPMRSRKLRPFLPDR